MSKRLDIYLVEAGLIESRNKAQARIAAGEVFVNGAVVAKASLKIMPGDAAEIREHEHHWVSRSGEKLAGAFAAWNIDVRDKTCLDVGASTGGFTEVLLARGARKVYAIDVGHGQLHESLRSDPRVVDMEGTNIRAVSKDDLSEPIECIVIDVSFISLEIVLPVVHTLLVEGGVCIALVKPQFEAGKRGTMKGIVKKDLDRTRIVERVEEAAHELGFTDIRRIDSPVTGEKGNKEFLLFLKK